MGFLSELSFKELEKRGEFYPMRPPDAGDFEPWHENESQRSVYNQFVSPVEIMKETSQLIHNLRHASNQKRELKYCLQTYFTAQKLIDARLSGCQPPDLKRPQ